MFVIPVGAVVTGCLFLPLWLWLGKTPLAANVVASKITWPCHIMVHSWNNGLILKGDWCRLHNYERYDLYTSDNIFRLIQSRIMRWQGVGHVQGRVEVHTGIWWANMNERNTMKYIHVDRRIILKLIFKKIECGLGLDWSGSEQEQVASSSEHNNKSSCSIKCREFLN